MYKSAAEYLQLPKPKRENLAFPPLPKSSYSTASTSSPSLTFPYLKSPSDFTPDADDPNLVVQVCPKPVCTTEEGKDVDDVNSTTVMNWKVKRYPSTSDPAVFGPPLWFSYHNMSYYYPTNPSQIVQNRMKGIILGIPYMLPCESCFNHATAYIESKKSDLDIICSSRDKLFKFFVDFHNYVNKRFGKREYSVNEALRMYGSDIMVKKMSYS